MEQAEPKLEFEAKREPKLEFKLEPEPEPKPELELVIKREFENLRPYGPDDLCDCNPEFAIICSFISQFGDKVDLELNIEQLKNGLENQENLDDNLIDLHVKLLKKLRRYFVRDQWEKALIRFAYEYSYEDAQEIENLGYVKTRPSIKLQLLRRLLDAQFECDQKFKTTVNTLEANELRNQPLGRDIKGNIYWHCGDKEGNFRVFSEAPLDHKSWNILCKNPNDLSKLIEDLDRTKNDKITGDPPNEPYNPYPDIFPEYFVKLEEEVEEIQDKKRTSKKYSKKGRRGRAQKKSSPSNEPAALDEIQSNSTIKVEPPHEDVQDQTIIANIHETDGSLKSEVSSQAGLIESQVKQTLDNLISKVATSFDFFFRWNSTDTKTKEEQPATKPKKRNTKRGKTKTEELPRRTSSRIQQLQQKKITEYVEKHIPNQRIPELETRVSRPSKVETCSNSINNNQTSSKTKKRAKKDRQRWKVKGKKKLSWDKDDSDLSSISSLTDSNDESFVEELNGALNPETVHDSDEFACEEEETNDAPVIIKRARTARQIVDEENGLSNNNSLVEEDKPCGRCGKSDNPDWILLCDMCDDGYHTSCCVPSLMFVPDGDWFCLPCEHKTLTSKLKDILASVNECIASKERERLKRQKLRQAFKKTTITTENDEIVPAKRKRNDTPSLNPPIAVQNLDEYLGESSGQELSDSYRERAYREPKKAKKKKKTKLVRTKKRRRDITDDEDEDDDFSLNKSSRKTYSRWIVSETESEGEESTVESDDDTQLKTRKARACVSYRFQEYDELIQSAIRADSDGPISDVESPEEEEPTHYGRGKDMATIEAIAYKQENGIEQQELNIATVDDALNDATKSSKQRKKGRRLNDLDAESEIDIATSDDSFQAASDTEEEEEEELTEVDSDEESSIDEIVDIRPMKSRSKRKKERNRYVSDDEDYEPRGRRNASKRISYKESTDEDEIGNGLDNEDEYREEDHVEDDEDEDEDEDQDDGSFLGKTTGILNTFNMSHPAKNPPQAHPPFYQDDEVRPSPQNQTNVDTQKTW